MPTEYREIGFSLTEVGQAIQAHRSVQNPELPLRRPLALRLEHEPEVTLYARFEHDEDEEPYSALQITAALIRHAKAINIPVARKSRKSLAIKNDTVLLRLWIS